MPQKDRYLTDVLILKFFAIFKSTDHKYTARKRVNNSS